MINTDGWYFFTFLKISRRIVYIRTKDWNDYYKNQL